MQGAQIQAGAEASQPRGSHWMTNNIIARLLLRRAIPADEESHGVRMSQSGFIEQSIASLRH